jgi:hypothetical protein
MDIANVKAGRQGSQVSGSPSFLPATAPSGVGINEH